MHSINYNVKISSEQERRLDYMKYRKFRLRCMIAAFVDQFNSDDDDSPGEFADATDSGLTKLIYIISAYSSRTKNTLIRFALQQLRKSSKKRAFSQILVAGSATLAID